MVAVIVIVGLGPLDSVEFGLDSGDGFVIATLKDDDGDGRIETLAPLNSTMAIGLNQSVVGNSGAGLCLLWDLTGSDIHKPHVPYEVPVFAWFDDDPGDGSLGIDYGTLLPPPTFFSRGETLSVTDGRLPEWSEPRFIDDTGAAGLADFVALRNSLPNFAGNVTVSDLRIRVEAVVPEPTTLVLSVAPLLLGVVYLFRSCERRSQLTFHVERNDAS